jgi:NhaP-type Na+/H+ or K+/H+ antiporter
LLEWSRGKAFIIPFILGAIGGHLFLATQDSTFKMSESMYPVLILFGIAIISFVIGYKVPFKNSNLFLSGLLILGVLYGHFFWSMNYTTSM